MTSENHNNQQAAPASLMAAPPELAALIESGQLSRPIVEGVPEGVVVYDCELRYRLWNRFMEKLTGQPAAEVLGKHALEIHAFLKESGIDVLLKRALAGQPTPIPDTPYAQRRTNWSGYIGGHLTPLRDQQNAIIGVLGVFQDGTRRKRTEEQLVAHEQRYRCLFEDNPQPMWVHDVETLAFLAVNEAALRDYGYTREEFFFKTLNDILASASVPAGPRGGAELRGGVDESRVWQHRTKSGKIIDVEINSRVVTLGGRRAVLVVANDVTERRRAQQTLRENESKYRSLIEAADVAIFLVDAETGLILEANRRAETLVGLPRHKIVGMSQEELAPPEQAAARREALPQSNLPFGKAAPQTCVWHRAGRRIAVDVINSVIEIGGRKVVQSIYRDITERKRAEEALARRSHQLEVLARANRQIHVVLEVPVILRSLVAAAMELVQATGGMVGLVANGELVMAEYHAPGKIVPVNYRFRPGQGVAGYVMSSKLTYYSNDPLEDPLVLPEVQRDFHLHNLVGVPVLGRGGQLLGCLELHNTENQQALGENDLTALGVLAGGAAIAIENAQLIEAQRRAEARSRRLAESAVDVIWSVDLELRFTDVTPSAALLFGYAPAEMIGRSIFDLLAPESAAVVKQAVGQGLKRDRLAQKDVTWSRLMELEQVRKDGTRVWVEAKVRILFDENKAPVGFAGVTRDISDRRRAQAEIERSLALHAASLESVPDGILVVDAEGRMVNFNQRFVHMWRIPKALIETRQDEQALEFVLSQLKEPEAFLSKVKQLYATPDAESHDHIAFKDGRVFERFSSPQRVRGQVTGRVWSFRDVTARAEAKAIRAASRAGRSKPR